MLLIDFTNYNCFLKFPAYTNWSHAQNGNHVMYMFRWYRSLAILHCLGDNLHTWYKECAQESACKRPTNDIGYMFRWSKSVVSACCTCGLANPSCCLASIHCSITDSILDSHFLWIASSKALNHLSLFVNSETGRQAVFLLAEILQYKFHTLV